MVGHEEKKTDKIMNTSDAATIGVTGLWDLVCRESKINKDLDELRSKKNKKYDLMIDQNNDYGKY